MNEQMRELLEKAQEAAVQVGETASDAAYGVGKKAGELLGVAKLRIRIATLEGQVEGCLAEIGEMIYATHTGSPTDSDVLLEKLREIDELKARIREVNAQIAAAQGGTVCARCGAPATPGDRFCRDCGGEL